MNLLYIGSHSILEYDEVRLFASLGHDVFSIGAYTDPANPSDDKRPPIDMPYHPDLAALCQKQREKHAGEDARFYIDFAKSDLHPDLLDWADVIIFAAFPEAWLVPQMRKLGGKRVIWRTIGQSDPGIEQYVARDAKAIEIVRYSPAERRAFEPLGTFAGEDAVIRFAKDPADWYGWTGEDRVIGNITQDMYGRGEACGYSFWMAATKDLPTKPAGPNSQALPGGIGPLGYDAMRDYLRKIRTYLYTGTQPASYTLGLIEALMTGTPVISMGPEHYGLPALFEGHEIALTVPHDAIGTREVLSRWLNDDPDLRRASIIQRQRAIDLFGIDTISRQWADYLGLSMSRDVALATQPGDIEPEAALVAPMVVSFDAPIPVANRTLSRADHLPADGGVPDGGPRSELVRRPFRMVFRGGSVAAGSIGALAARSVAALCRLILGRGVVFGNGDLPSSDAFGLGARHDDKYSAAAV